MASLVFDNVTVDFVVYGSSRSFRSALRGATGGLVRREGAGSSRVTVRALDGLNLSLGHGDRLGIIGHNGAGKTTLLRVCAGVYEPTGGRVISEGRISSLLTTFPGIDLDDSGYENIITIGMFLGMSFDEIQAKMPDIEECSELGEYLTLPCRTYSTGMLIRLGFAIATAVDPEILILDEGLSAGDARFTERAAGRIRDLIQRSHVLVLASHSEALIRAYCNRAILLKEGRLMAEGSVDEVFDAYGELAVAPESGAEAAVT
ncbi:MAG: ABC transporter ATP-binding protein [Pseudomonadota bacterium]